MSFDLGSLLTEPAAGWNGDESYKSQHRAILNGQLLRCTSPTFTEAPCHPRRAPIDRDTSKVSEISLNLSCSGMGKKPAKIRLSS